MAVHVDDEIKALHRGIIGRVGGVLVVVTIRVLVVVMMILMMSIAGMWCLLRGNIVQVCRRRRVAGQITAAPIEHAMLVRATTSAISALIRVEALNAASGEL